MLPNSENGATDVESVGSERRTASQSTDPSWAAELAELCNKPDMVPLMRACARLPAETRATLEQYLNGCFLEAVTARIEPDGSLKLDTVNAVDPQGAAQESLHHPSDRSGPIRKLWRP